MCNICASKVSDDTLVLRPDKYKEHFRVNDERAVTIGARQLDGRQWQLRSWSKSGLRMALGAPAALTGARQGGRPLSGSCEPQALLVQIGRLTASPGRQEPAPFDVCVSEFDEGIEMDVRQILDEGFVTRTWRTEALTAPKKVPARHKQSHQACDTNGIRLEQHCYAWTLLECGSCVYPSSQCIPLNASTTFASQITTPYRVRVAAFLRGGDDIATSTRSQSTLTFSCLYIREPQLYNFVPFCTAPCWGRLRDYSLFLVIHRYTLMLANQFSDPFIFVKLRSFSYPFGVISHWGSSFAESEMSVKSSRAASMPRSLTKLSASSAAKHEVVNVTVGHNPDTLVIYRSMMAGSNDDRCMPVEIIRSPGLSMLFLALLLALESLGLCFLDTHCNERATWMEDTIYHPAGQLHSSGRRLNYSSGILHYTPIYAPDQLVIYTPQLDFSLWTYCLTSRHAIPPPRLNPHPARTLTPPPSHGPILSPLPSPPASRPWSSLHPPTTHVSAECRMMTASTTTVPPPLTPPHFVGMINRIPKARPDELEGMGEPDSDAEKEEEKRISAIPEASTDEDVGERDPRTGEGGSSRTATPTPGNKRWETAPVLVYELPFRPDPDAAPLAFCHRRTHTICTSYTPDRTRNPPNELEEVEIQIEEVVVVRPRQARARTPPLREAEAEGSGSMAPPAGLGRVRSGSVSSSSRSQSGNGSGSMARSSNLRQIPRAVQEEEFGNFVDVSRDSVPEEGEDAVDLDGGMYAGSGRRSYAAKRASSRGSGSVMSDERKDAFQNRVEFGVVVVERWGRGPVGGSEERAWYPLGERGVVRPPFDERVRTSGETEDQEVQVQVIEDNDELENVAVAFPRVSHLAIGLGFFDAEDMLPPATVLAKPPRRERAASSDAGSSGRGESERSKGFPSTGFGRTRRATGASERDAVAFLGAKGDGSAGGICVGIHVEQGPWSFDPKDMVPTASPLAKPPWRGWAASRAGGSGLGDGERREGIALSEPGGRDG
ncbi:hypothetical protein DFP72DRAFT_854184 [Ephemerocybe angulata]|uniref:Uncharacterized protein n=1 Tax=Ephemerocybe angulata TaxID=980116 RepID=A0A8H6HKU8_9AGAR|nr:hypothetical protein DFP72DRAFT_854184 [Tulosesus angulatus]